MAKKSAKVSQEFGSSEAEECGRIVAQAWQKCGASVAEVQGKRGRSAGQAWQKCGSSVAEGKGPRSFFS